MDSQQAREILKLFRPGTMDATEPEMAEALQVVQRDPALAKWFDEHCSVYIAMRNKLKQIPVPPDLKRRILIENVGRRRIIPLFDRRTAWLAVAAAIALGAFVWWLNLPTAVSTFPNFRDHMVRLPQRGPSTYMMDMTNANLAVINTYLQTNGWPADYKLPKEIAKLPGEGCGTLVWHDHRVSMVCLDAGLNPRTGLKRELFFYVADRGVFSDAPPGKPVFSRVNHLMSAAWSSGSRVYILAVQGDEAEARRYLEGVL